MASTVGAALRALIAGLPLLCLAALRAVWSARRVAVRVPLGAAEALPAAPATLLRALAAERGVRAVDLDLRGLAVGGATADDLRAAILALRAAGTLVSARADAVDLRGLQVLAAATHSTLTPSGEVVVTGMGSTQPFFADLLAAVGVRAELLSAGAYKSFGERYTRSAPSPAHRQSLAHVLSGLQHEAISGIAVDRKVDPAAVSALIGTAPAEPRAVLDARLVDAVAYPDQARAGVTDLLGGTPDGRGLGLWWRLSSAEAGLRAFVRGGPRIVCVQLDGPIQGQGSPLTGRGPRIDVDTVVPVLEALADDPGVAAVVLEIDSPGGSALDSDLIARAIRLLGDRKPVIALLGDVAASGGYYIAAPCSEIIARPSTITGSIGVVGGKIVLRGALTRLGVHPETIAVGADSDLLSPFAGWDRDQTERFRAALDRTYSRFLGVVSGGRRMPMDAVHAVAQGRIWTGRQALEHGLVDRLGDRRVALERARLLAGLGPGAGRLGVLRVQPAQRGLLRSLLSTRTAPTAAELPGLLMGVGGQSEALLQVLGFIWARPLSPLCIAPLELDAVWSRGR